MAETAHSSADLGFKLAGGLGEYNPLLRGVVSLQRLSSIGAGIDVGGLESFDAQARRLSASFFDGSVLIAAVDAGKPQQPLVASVISRSGLKRGVRRELRLRDIVADPECEDRDVLIGTLVALSCQGRNRFRPIQAAVNPVHEATVEALSKLGFKKDDESSGIEVYVGMQPDDIYTIGAGQLAIHGANQLPGGQDMLREAQQNLSWD